MADQKAGPMGVEWALRARALLAGIRHGVLCFDQAEMHADIVAKALAAAEAAGREKGLEEARLAVEDEEEGPHGQDYQLGDVSDFRHRCVARIRALAAQPPAKEST